MTDLRIETKLPVNAPSERSPLWIEPKGLLEGKNPSFVIGEGEKTLLETNYSRELFRAYRLLKANKEGNLPNKAINCHGVADYVIEGLRPQWKPSQTKKDNSVPLTEVKNSLKMPCGIQFIDSIGNIFHNAIVLGRHNDTYICLNKFCDGNFELCYLDDVLEQCKGFTDVSFYGNHL